MLLLHGLAGHAEEWSDTSSWLAAEHHVFALDIRGHGRSERRPSDVSTAALVEDVVATTEHIGCPVILGGQSLGGLISILVAAAEPDLVQALVVVEASPTAMDEQAAMTLAAEVKEKLSSWPTPFRSREAAIRFFGGPSVAATAWAAGLEERDDGLWPRFDVDVLVTMLEKVVRHDHWSEWDRIRCPALVVRGETGSLSVEDARAMEERLSQAQLVEIPGAGHDVHLDRPDEWRKGVSTFLRGLV